MINMSGTRGSELKTSFLAGAAFLAFASPAVAQEQPATPDAAAQSPGNGVDEIIVTAQKRSERLSDVPLSITAATGAQLQSRGITTADQLVKVVPGFTYQASDFGAPIYGIRGVSFFSVSPSAIPAVAVYVDQVPLPLSILTKGAPLDIERVEVLKGPQGTLFGGSTTGGAVNYIAAKPTDTFKAGGDLLYGRFSQLEAGAYASGPLSGTVKARLSARTEQRNDWQRSVSRDDSAGQRDFNEARLLIDFEPSSDLRFGLNINGWVDRSDSPTPQFRKFVPSNPGTNPGNPGWAPAFFAFAGPGAIPAATIGAIPPGLKPGPIMPIGGNARAVDFDPGFSRRNNDRFWQTSLRSEYDMGNFATLTSLTSYLNFKGHQVTDPDGTDYSNVLVNQIQDFKTFTQELRLAGDAGPLKWTLGGYYEHTKLFADGVNVNGGTNSTFVGVHYETYGTRSLEKIDTKAVFGGVDYELASGFTVRASARYTAEKRKFDGCTYAPTDATGQGLANAFTAASTFLRTVALGLPVGPTPQIQPGECVTLDTSNPTSNPGILLPVDTVLVNTDRNNFAWKIGADWKPNRDLMIFANVTRGYKAGGVNSIPAPSSAQLFAIEEESVLVYEAGIKATLPAARMSVEASAFHYDYKNKQTGGRFVDAVFGNLPALVNVPKSTVDGAELTINWQPVTGLRLNSSLIYTDAKVTSSFITPDPVGNIVDVKGNQLPGSTKWQALSDVEYRFPVSGTVNAYLGGSLTYHSRSNAQFGNNPDFALPAYTLLDLRAGLAGIDNEWSVEAFGRNITNKYYWTNVSVSGDVQARYAAMPVTYGIRLTFHYR